MTTLCTSSAASFIVFAAPSPMPSDPPIANTGKVSRRDLRRSFWPMVFHQCHEVPGAGCGVVPAPGLARQPAPALVGHDDLKVPDQRRHREPPGVPSLGPAVHYTAALVDFIAYDALTF
jgi:hypothetical protein